jgi:hypothetical protein
MFARSKELGASIKLEGVKKYGTFYPMVRLFSLSIAPPSIGGCCMLAGIWSWLIRWSEVSTNVLDLLAFVLASPELIGRARIEDARARVINLRTSAYSYWPILVFIYSVFLLVAGGTSYWLVSHAFRYSIVLGIACSVVVGIAFLYALWGVVSLSMMQDADTTFASLINLYARILQSIFSFTGIMTPRGMLYAALGVFFISRVLGVVHAVAVH